MSEQIHEANFSGEPVAEYAPTSRNVKLNKIAGLIIGVPGAALIIAGAILIFSDTRLFCLLIFGLCGVALGVWSYIRGLQQAELRVVLYPEGLVHTQRSGTAAYRWDEIKEVRQRIIKTRQRGGPSSTSHVYTIVDAQGREATFDDKLSTNVQALGQTIQEKVTKRLLPQAIQAYNTGETLAFGKLSLSKEGLNTGKETVPWEQIESIGFRAGKIELKRKDKRFASLIAGVDQIPNVYVFMALAKSVSGTAD